MERNNPTEARNLAFPSFFGNGPASISGLNSERGPKHIDEAPTPPPAPFRVRIACHYKGHVYYWRGDYTEPWTADPDRAHTFSDRKLANDYAARLRGPAKLKKVAYLKKCIVVEDADPAPAAPAAA